MKNVLLLILLVISLGSCKKEDLGCMVCSVNAQYDNETDRNQLYELGQLCKSPAQIGSGYIYQGIYDPVTRKDLTPIDGTTVTRQYSETARDSLTHTLTCIAD